MNSAASGSFHLRPGIQLVNEKGEKNGGGIVLQPSPLRALRMNPSAFGLLKQCRDGFSFTDDGKLSQAQFEKNFLPFLDSLCQAEILEWRPPETPFEPFVSIIIPVYNREREIDECLSSLEKLNYPRSSFEIIVVDDGSSDRSADAARKHGAKVLVSDRNQGPAAARNLGVLEARGKIVAFIDSDCIASPNWLKELVPYLKDDRHVLVGGYVDSYYNRSFLDRYEAVASALNMGRKKVIGAGKNSVFYVPTCNVLFLKEVFLEVGGLNGRMRVGEDVDLCWRLLKAGHRLIYVPEGAVKHKHRNDFFPCFKRRFDYGTSEAVLYGKYPETTKRFPWQSGGMVFFLLCLIGLAGLPLTFFSLAGLLLVGEAFYKKTRLETRFNATLSFKTILWSVFRSHFLFIHYLAYHITRYYFILLCIVTLCWPGMISLTLGVAALPAVVEYFAKKPRLNLPAFVFFFWMEHAFYQAGVFAGCIRRGSFRLYRISFVHAGFIKSDHPFHSWLKRAFGDGRQP